MNSLGRIYGRRTSISLGALPCAANVAEFEARSRESVVKFAIVFLEVLFAIGVIGSALVVLLTSIEDVIEIIRPDTPAQNRSEAKMAAD
jgi:hypothetical protein